MVKFWISNREKSNPNRTPHKKSRVWDYKSSKIKS